MGVGSRLPGGLTGVLRLFGSRGACRRHRSCALGVSKRFGAVSGHLPVVTIQVLRRLRHHCRCVWWLATCLGVGSRLPGGLTGVLRLFGSRGACRRHRSCALGVSKRFGAVSGHLPVAWSVFFGNPQSLFNLVHGIAVDGRAVAHEPPQCWGYSCTGVSIGEQR